jgi:polyisoprenoid-binding protein YceI
MNLDMKKLVFAAWIICFAQLNFAQYKPTDQGSSVKFKVKNFGFNSGGSFSGLHGIIDFDPEKVADSKFDVTIQATSVNTDNESRDNHLREESYFDVKNYPLIRFVSTKITGKGASFTVTGNLTIKKKTKEISFPFTITQEKDGYLFKGDFNINRKEFGVGGSSTISENVDVLLSIHAQKG